jgi:hypothetical protein
VANLPYTAFVTGVMNAEYDLNTATVKVALVRSYTFSAAHATMADALAAGAVVNGSATLASAAITGGNFTAADATLTTTASAVAHALLFYQSSAVTGGADVATSAQKLICYADTGAGIAVYPPTGSITLSLNVLGKILSIA